jgi:hypothetical protein
VYKGLAAMAGGMQQRGKNAKALHVAFAFNRGGDNATAKMAGSKPDSKGSKELSNIVSRFRPFGISR